MTHYTRTFGRVVDLRERILQQRVIDAEDSSLDREALHVHALATMRLPASAFQSKAPPCRRKFDTTRRASRAITGKAALRTEKT